MLPTGLRPETEMLDGYGVALLSSLIVIGAVFENTGHDCPSTFPAAMNRARLESNQFASEREPTAALLWVGWSRMEDWSYWDRA
jgi:hypothetical protein